MRQAKLLGLTTLFAGVSVLISDGWMRLLQFKLLQMDKWAGMKEAWHLQERFDEYYYMAAVNLIYGCQKSWESISAHWVCALPSTRRCLASVV
jgi:hypothetical protein